MKQIEVLGDKIANIMLGQNPRSMEIIDEVNTELTRMAMEVTGVRADQLSDENMEDKPIVRLYWRTLAELTAWVLHKAAEKQSYYRELDR